MFKNEYTLSVDLKKKMTSVMPTFIQYDNAVLIFKIFDDGKKFKLDGFTKAEVSHRKPDGTVEIGEAVIEGTGGNQWIKYTYYGTEMNQLGYVDTSLSLHSADKKVSIQPFKVFIAEDLAEQYASPANPQVGALQQLIATVEKLIVDAEAINKASTIQSAHAKTQGDYAKAQGDLAKDVRIATESERLATEQTRLNTEQVKANTEAERLATKAVKDATETTRVATEKVKTETAAAKDETIEATRLAKEAADAVHSVVDEWKYVEKYSLTRPYVKNNIVGYNGSSYIALKNNTGTAPTETLGDVNWSLVARKGQDGSGVVVLHRQSFTAVESQTEFILTNEYDQMQNRVRVVVDGVEQFSPTNFLELTSNKIKMNTPLKSGSDVIVVYFGNAPAIVNDTQLQLDNIKDTLSFLNLETIGAATAFATEQGNYAKTEGNKVASKITEVNTAISDVGAIKLAATTATTLANTSAGKADTATSNANNKATLAQVATDNANTATNIVNTLIPNIQGMENKGEYSTSVQYKKNNTVEYNGSSYQALQDTIGNRPPALPVKSTEFWMILAQRGIDGAGSVVMVNRISPDIDGNVDLGNLAADWNSLEGKPLEFNPTEHPISKVTGLQTELNSKETPLGAKAKADLAETNSKTYADTGLASKVDKAVGKQLSTEDFTTVEKTKLTGVEIGANKYTHPSSHPASIIIQDTSNRLVTDTQITSWNGKSTFNGNYGSLADIPATFVPSAHTHTIANVTGLQTELDKIGVLIDNTDTHKVTIATPTTLGHVKVGNNLTIDTDGKLNASGGTIPDASTTVKGIVKLNDTLASISTTEAATANTVKLLNDMKANKVQETLFKLSLMSGWTDIVSLTVFKDTLGIVRIHGWIQNGTGGNVFTLPLAYRPNSSVVFFAFGYTAGTTNTITGLLGLDGVFNVPPPYPSYVYINFSFRQ